MLMPIVQAAPAAAPPVPPVSNGAAPGDAAQFDQALSASLAGEQQLSAPGARLRAFAEVPALVEWFLTGAPDQTALPAIDGELPAGPDADADDDLAADEDVAAQLDAPVDVVVAALPPQPQSQPILVDGTAGQVEMRTDAPLPADTSAAMTTAPAQDAPAQVEAQDAPAPHVDAAEPPANFRTTPEAPMQQATVKAERTETPAPIAAPAPAPATSEAATGTESMTETAEPVDRTSTTAGEQPAVTRDSRRWTARPVETKAPAAPQAEATAAAATSASPAGTTVADVQLPARNGETRESVAPASRGAVFAAQAMLRQEMSGGDAQTFDQESHPSPAAQRLAAALSSAGSPPVETTGGAPAPVFSVPAATAAPAPVAPVQTAAPAQGPTPVDIENVNRLIETMRVTAKAGGWEATVRLRPEHLGEVTIALRVEGNTVSAVVQAESAGVRQWLQSQEDAVRSGLSEHGLDLGRYQVDRDGHRRDAEDPQQQQQHARRRGARRQQDGAVQRFEIVV